jgi:hypothetical protein
MIAAMLTLVVMTLLMVGRPGEPPAAIQLLIGKSHGRARHAQGRASQSQRAAQPNQIDPPARYPVSIIRAT